MKLAKWIALHGYTRSEVADMIGIHPANVTLYCQDARWPGREIATTIATVTKGKVMPNDFLRKGKT